MASTTPIMPYRGGHTWPTEQHSSRIGVTACSDTAAGTVSAATTGSFPAAVDPGMTAAGSACTAAAAAVPFTAPLRLVPALEDREGADASCCRAAAAGSMRERPGGCHSRAARSPMTSPGQHGHLVGARLCCPACTAARISFTVQAIQIRGGVVAPDGEVAMWLQAPSDLHLECGSSDVSQFPGVKEDVVAPRLHLVNHCWCHLLDELSTQAL